MKTVRVGMTFASVPAMTLPSSLAGKPRLLDRLRQALRVGHYSPRTEEAYVFWVRRYIVFHGRRHPETMAEAEVVAFLTHFAMKETVSASTQNQALAAIVFLYRYVLRRPLGDLGGVPRVRMPERLPVVLSREEVRAVLSHLRGPAWMWPLSCTARVCG